MSNNDQGLKQTCNRFKSIPTLFPVEKAIAFS